MLSKMHEMLEQSYNILNSRYFDNTLERVIIEIKSNVDKPYKASLCKNIWNMNGKQYRGIVINAKYLNSNIEYILGLLMHEMIHLYCQENNIVDAIDDYHTEEFKREAELRGLTVTKQNDAYGYWHTEPSKEFVQYIKEAGIKKPIEIYYDETNIEKHNNNTRIYRYKCSGCGNTFIASTNTIETKCKACNGNFICESRIM